MTDIRQNYFYLGVSVSDIDNAQFKLPGNTNNILRPDETLN